MSYTELLPPSEAVPSNPEWHKLRAGGVSASEIAAVLGLSPWESPFSLYWSKVNGWDQDDNDQMRAGRYAEDAIADWYADVCDPHENLRVLRAGLYASVERPWQLATPDRLIHMVCAECDGLGDYGNPFNLCNQCHGSGIELGAAPTALLECKYVIGGWDGWGEASTDDVPVYYRAQCLWQLDVMGVDEVHLAAWHGADFRVYIIRRDEKDLRVMRTAAERFLKRIADQDPPDVDQHTATIRTLKQLHPGLDDREQEIASTTAEGYRRARALKRHAEDLCNRFEARVRAEMGDARQAVSGGRKVASRSIFDVAETVRQGYTVDRLNPSRSK